MARVMIGEVRRFGAVNWLGFWTLYEKECRRFIKVYTQTLLAPMVTTLLYLSIFLLALGGADRMVGGVSYGTFLAPGLMMMAMTQNAFANTSSSIVISKVQGNIVDMLMPPISPAEAVLAMALGGATRGVVVGCAVSIAVMLFVHLPLQSLAQVLFFGFFGSLMLSLLGIIGGIWSEKFDQIAAVTNFIITPASFLSGTFYSVEALPERWRFVAHLDPFFYMIDGFRSGFIGHADADRLLGMAVMLGLDVALLAIAYSMFARGYKLKA